MMLFQNVEFKIIILRIKNEIFKYCTIPRSKNWPDFD